MAEHEETLVEQLRTLNSAPQYKNKEECEFDLTNDTSFTNRLALSSQESKDDSEIEWTFLQKVPKYLYCELACCNIFVEPHLLTCCGKNICKKCMDRYLQRVSTLANQTPSCPHCRKEDFQLIKDADLELCINLLKVECPYQNNGCSWTGVFPLGKLHLKECNFVPVKCPNACGCRRFERGKLCDHLQECTLQPVNCSFQDVGCDVGNLLIRGELSSHSVKNVHHHLLLIAQANTRILSECQKVPNSFDSKFTTKEEEISGNIHVQKLKLVELKSTMKKLELDIEEVQMNIENLCQESMKYTEIALSKLNQHLAQAEDNKALCKANLEVVKALPIAKTTRIFHLPVVFAIDKFKKRITTNNQWMSAPFYTHSGGYKLCLSVYPNGISEVQGKCVSISVHFMMGEFDDHLQWPFPGAIISVAAIRKFSKKGSVGSDCNISVHIEIGREMTRSMRCKPTNDSIDYGFSESKFLRHIDFPSFLNEDTLEILVYRVQYLPL